MKYASVNDYLMQQENTVREKLETLRAMILSANCAIEERISYQMPAYFYKNKPLIYFAAFKKHIGVYALPHAHIEFAHKLKHYKQGKGSVQFPLSEALPLDVVEEMLLFNLQKIQETTPE